MQATKLKNKFKLGLLYLFFLSFIFFVMDMACQYIIKSTFNISIYDEDYLEKKSVFYKNKESKYYVHPYFGLASIGDKKYKLSTSTKGINKNLMLHSYQIRFIIDDIKHTYTALLPEYFKKLLKVKRLNFSSLK